MLNTTALLSPSETQSIENFMSTANNPNKKEDAEEATTHKTEIKLKNNCFLKNQRKSDYNLNILDSELVTFRKNFHHHIPKKRGLKVMDSHPIQKNQFGIPAKSTSSTTMPSTNNKQHNYDNASCDKDNETDRYVWEMWMRTPNTTPASTVLNSPDVTEIEQAKNFQNQHQIKVGRSPVEGENEKNSPENCLSQHAFVNDGEVVVFDDIEDNWRETPSGTLDFSDIDADKLEDFENIRCETEAAGFSSSKLTKMIGVLPINDYEGSPRRFGNINYSTNTSLPNPQTSSQSHTTSLQQSFFPPRPGFPKRVLENPVLYNQDDVVGINPGLDIGNNSMPHELNQKELSFDYVYEFSETRKVLEEFFKSPNDDDKKLTDLNESEAENYMELNQIDTTPSDNLYIGQRLAIEPKTEFSALESPRSSGVYNHTSGDNYDHNEIELYLDSGSRSSGELADTELEINNRRHSRNFTLSPETTDYDSNFGDLDSLSNEVNNGIPDFVRLYTSMPVLEDGLSSGHASDTENNNPAPVVVERQINDIPVNNKVITEKLDSPMKPIPGMAQRNDSYLLKSLSSTNANLSGIDNSYNTSSTDNNSVDTCKMLNKNDQDVDSLYAMNIIQSTPPPPPAPVPHRSSAEETEEMKLALRDIQASLKNTQTLTNEKINTNYQDPIETTPNSISPIWIPRKDTSQSHESIDSENPSKVLSCDDEEADTDLETDRLLGQQRLDDQGFLDDKIWCDRKLSTKTIKSPTNSNNISQFVNTATARSGIGTANLNDLTQSVGGCEGSDDANNVSKSPAESINSQKDKASKSKNKEVRHDPAVLIEGVLFRARYLGSTQLVCEGQPTKTTRMMQAEEAVSRIKAPEGESQPSTEVDLFISTEKIMVLNTDLKEIMMDHALRTISYIADIGDLVVLMARRRFVPSDIDDMAKPNRTPKMICHVFESEEAQFIAQSIGQAFQVAYMEFLKANGIEDHSFVKEMDYQEVLNSQEIFGDELEIFAKKELQKEVVVPKAKGEILGVVIVESGWGSMLPTVVIANLLSTGSAARCGQLNIGDQIIAINGLSLVGLPLSTCQNYIRNTKNQTAVKFTVVPCPPVVEVKIKRPNTKYQLGFSVQNGVICSLLRGGIAERGGVRVGHRIIEINNQSVVAVPHEKIVNLLATSVGEILMKTMPTSMFRLLTGQENPIFI